jgi:hypothetical protein
MFRPDGFSEASDVGQGATVREQSLGGGAAETRFYQRYIHPMFLRCPPG